jgi:hypothetical protein
MNIYTHIHIHIGLYVADCDSEGDSRTLQFLLYYSHFQARAPVTSVRCSYRHEL